MYLSDSRTNHHKQSSNDLSPTAPTAPLPRSAPPAMSCTPIPAKRKSIAVPLNANSLHPLEKEIERLSAACEEHERVIRSTLSTVRHHLLTNIMEGVFERVAQIDDDAEMITSSIQQSLQSHIPAFQAHLRESLKVRAVDVELMRERTTPWKDVVDDGGASSESSDIRRGIDGALSPGKKLKRIEGGGGETDALTRVELWADELEMYLNNEIVRTNERIKIKRTRRYYLYHAIIYTMVVMGIVGSCFLLYYPSAAVWSWAREWRDLHSVND